ncbi:uncharacterized protein TNCT_300341 [Trichonephila clavata]|uniref:Uncharacterized protein n=1 Tax=Trichonephila clavata TaxID=2740835 RepID=A0A8X6FP19_TRICU|nr:uncharacterized protein TNCT_300341 [Trichonephila clavata]
MDSIVGNLCFCEHQSNCNSESYSLEDINSQMRKIWEIDNFGITDNSERESSEEETLKQFEQNIKFKNGRYEVKLPFKDEVNITSNFNLAKNRLKGLASRFRKDNSLYENYTSVLDSQLKDGIIESEIWEGGFDWAEEFGKNSRTKWKKWCKEFHSLVNLSIPRYYFKIDKTNEEFNEYQIVIFCDASERVYGAIAYIRYKGNSDFHVNFVSSKARVAPLKKLNLRSLELLATLI